MKDLMHILDTWLLFDVSGRTRRFINGPAFGWTLTIADFSLGFVAFSNLLRDSLLLERNLTGLLEVLLTNLFLGRDELRDISVVAFFLIFMDTLQNWVFGDGFNL